MKNIIKGILQLLCSLVGIVLALPIAVPLADFLVSLEPIMNIYNSILYLIDKFIGIFM